MAMKVLAVLALLSGAVGAEIKQNPCAGCNEAGLVTGEQGTKKDVSCCLKKEKHDRCLECKSMDCAHNTCTINKQYYAERTLTEAENKRDKDWDSKAMKAAGWGTDNTAA